MFTDVIPSATLLWYDSNINSKTPSCSCSSLMGSPFSLAGLHATNNTSSLCCADGCGRAVCRPRSTPCTHTCTLAALTEKPADQLDCLTPSSSIHSSRHSSFSFIPSFTIFAFELARVSSSYKCGAVHKPRTVEQHPVPVQMHTIKQRSLLTQNWGSMVPVK